MRGVEAEWRKAWWRHRGWETSFAGPGGNSANPEARRSFLRGTWRLCTPLPRPGKTVYFTTLKGGSYDQLEPQAHVLLTVKSVFIRESLDLIPALSYMSHHNKEMLQEVQSDQDIGSYEKWL